MTKLITLMKSAPITVISILAVVLGLAFFAWAWSKSSSFRESLAERGREVRNIENLMEERIQIPGPEAGDEPVTISVPINPYTIEALSTLDTALEAEFKAVHRAAVAHNRGNHTLLVEGAIPEPENPTKPIDAREAYKTMLPRLLQSPEEAAAAQRDAGEESGAESDEGPDETDSARAEPTDEAATDDESESDSDAQDDTDADAQADVDDDAEQDVEESVEEELADSTERAIAEAKAQAAELPRLIVGLPPSREELQRQIGRFEEDLRRSILAMSDQDRSLTREEVQRLNDQKRSRLREMLYSRARRVHVYANPRPGGEGFPLHFAPLREADPPRPYQIWEAQLELWIQQDIIEAIGLANNVSDPDASVLTGPVKRLESVRVLPGYVGLHTRGGAVEQGGQPGAPYRQPENYTLPSKSNVPRDFYVGPTGRVSNSVYDVRHVELQMVVDYTRLPVLFNALSRVNFMTVLRCELSEVDEYEAYREGFVYGPDADVVHARIVVESLWLRDWTEPMMPERVKQYLGILDPYTGEGEEQDPMMGPGEPWDPEGGEGGAPW